MKIVNKEILLNNGYSLVFTTSPLYGYTVSFNMQFDHETMEICHSLSQENNLQSVIDYLRNITRTHNGDLMLRICEESQ